MLRFWGKVFLFFTVGETSLHRLLWTYLPVLLLLAPAVMLATFGLSPPLVLRLGYTIAVAALVGGRIARTDVVTKFRASPAIVVLPLFLLGSWPLDASWRLIFLAAVHGAVYLASMRYAARDNDLYLHEEFPLDDAR